MPAAVLPDYILDAAAFGRLVIVTGAGVSVGVKRPDGRGLPNWGELVTELRTRVGPSMLSGEEELLLDRLLPASALDALHGDVLIEASEIIQRGFVPGTFQHAIAEVCREASGEMSDTHRAIAAICPVGVITFNYDRGHECAFEDIGQEYRSIIYNDDDEMKLILSGRESVKPFVLKAHGSVNAPETLVLTSGSYREILSRNRVYRAFLQHVLIRNTVLIVGFAMRDRDFDQLLNTLELEFGTPIQPHAFIAKEPDSSYTGLTKRAEWAAVTARFGVQAIYVSDYAEIPGLIRTAAIRPGPKINNILERTTSKDRQVRASAHDDIELLGSVGKAQVRQALLDRLDGAGLDVDVRSETIYALRGIGDSDPDVARRLVQEVEFSINLFSAAASLGPIECAAHAFLVLRRSRVESPLRENLVRRIMKTEVMDALSEMDRWLLRAGKPERLVVYARAACAEITARGVTP